MADNGTAGSAPTIAWDDITGVIYQRVKQALGPDGTATADWAGRDLGNSEGGAGYVDLRQKVNVQAQASSGLTTSTTSYSAGDQLGAILTFTSMARVSGGTGKIRGITVVDKNKVLGAIDLFLYDQSVTLASDNAAGPGISDADALNCVGIIQMPAFTVDANNYVSHLSSIVVPYKCNATSLFVAMVTRTAHSFFAAGTDIQVKLHAELD